MKKLFSIFGVAALLATILFTGCHSPKFEQGGAYAPTVTNTDGTVTASTAPETALYIADAAYKFAYDTIAGVFKFEYDNRERLQSVSPKIKTELDKLRPTAWQVEQRWALARSTYKANPTPANLTAVQNALAEIQRLVPVVQQQLTVQ